MQIVRLLKRISARKRRLLIIFSALFITSTCIYAGGKYKIHGEYGLWITETNGKVTVNWLTRAEETTGLMIQSDGQEILNIKNGPAKKHSAEFESAGKTSFTITINSKVTGVSKTQIDLEPVRSGVIIENVDSLYVIGDIHGDFDGFIKLMIAAGLIDREFNWKGARAHLVVLGDIFDKGYDVTRCLWFLYGMQQKAEAAGGCVHVILGNHEIMALGDDLRYVTGKEAIIANMHGVKYSAMFDPKTSILGRWLSSRPGMIKIDDLLLAHAGVSMAYADYTVTAFNDSLWKYLHEPAFKYLLRESIAKEMLAGDTLAYNQRLSFFYGEESVFWYRGYAQQLAALPELSHVLMRFNAKKHIIAHTPGQQVNSLYDNRILTVDLQDHLSQMLLMVKRGISYEMYRVKPDGSSESF